jgi:hypothetical protein
MNAQQLLKLHVGFDITLKNIFDVASFEGFLGDIAVDEQENIALRAAETLLANIRTAGGINVLGPMLTYIQPEGLWAIIEDGKNDCSKTFTAAEILEQIENLSYSESVLGDLHEHVTGANMRHWVRNETGNFEPSLGWQSMLSFRWTKVSSRIVSLYAFIAGSDRRFLSMEMYVKPTGADLGGGHIYHVVKYVECLCVAKS